MNSLRSQLPDPDALLLMYAAGELPPDDRDAVERDLATDAGLRDRLASIQQMLGETGSAFETLDAATSRAFTNAAANRASNAIRQWQAQRLATRVVKPPALPQRFEWARPAAAVAAMLLITAGVIAMKNWPTKGTGQQAGVPRSDDRRGLPAFANPEERDFHFNALDQLARGGDALEDSESIPVSEAQPQVMPPGPEEGTAVAGLDQPFFDVPLTPDADPLP